MEDHGRKGSPESTRKSDSKPDVVINMPVPELHSVGGVLVHMPHVRFLLYVIIICQKTKKKTKDVCSTEYTESHYVQHLCVLTTQHAARLNSMFFLSLFLFFNYEMACMTIKHGRLIYVVQ